MYAWIWHHLPPGPALRLTLATALVLAVLALLFLVVFPAVETVLPSGDPTAG